MIKQVIVARTDLDMPIGRIPAQVAHASIAIFLDMGEWDGNNFVIKDVPSDVRYWMEKSFTKVVLKCHSEKALEELEQKAKGLDLPTAMIEDDIGSDYHKMTLGIGPADSKIIDTITGNLKLL